MQYTACSVVHVAPNSPCILSSGQWHHHHPPRGPNRKLGRSLYFPLYFSFNLSPKPLNLTNSSKPSQMPLPQCRLRLLLPHAFAISSPLISQKMAEIQWVGWQHGGEGSAPEMYQRGLALSPSSLNWTHHEGKG